MIEDSRSQSSGNNDEKLDRILKLCEMNFTKKPLESLKKGAQAEETKTRELSVYALDKAAGDL